MFILICTWINTWVNKREAGDVRRHRTDYDVIAMVTNLLVVLGVYVINGSVVVLANVLVDICPELSSQGLVIRGHFAPRHPGNCVCSLIKKFKLISRIHNIVFPANVFSDKYLNIFGNIGSGNGLQPSGNRQLITRASIEPDGVKCYQQ